ncbi:MAG: shikimate kinase [Desulfobulbaceae bacterium]
MADNIILIGFMGVGKGRTARALATQTGLFALDTDDLIQSLAKMKIRRIFEQHGEPYFRQLEQKVADWLGKNVRNTIVSAGGGFFMVRKLARKGDRVVYLHASLESILTSVNGHPQAERKIKKRPLLQDLDKARRLYEERLPEYRAAADLEIDVEGLTATEVAGEIIRRLEL